MTQYIQLTDPNTIPDSKPNLGYLYRCFERVYAAPLDEYDNPSGPGRVQVCYDRYKIVKRTPKGAWIDNYGDRKFVLLTAHKKFACETKELAQESFIARKERQIRILSAQIKQAEQAIAMTKRKDISDYLL